MGTYMFVSYIYFPFLLDMSLSTFGGIILWHLFTGRVEYNPNDKILLTWAVKAGMSFGNPDILQEVR